MFYLFDFTSENEKKWVHISSSSVMSLSKISITILSVKIGKVIGSYISLFHIGFHESSHVLVFTGLDVPNENFTYGSTTPIVSDSGLIITPL